MPSKHDDATPQTLLTETRVQARALERGDRVASRIRTRERTAREFAVDLPPPFLAHRIQRMRKRLRLSQAIFAALLNVEVATVQKWEQGINVPDGASRRLLEIAEQYPTVLTRHLGIRP